MEANVFSYTSAISVSQKARRTLQCFGFAASLEATLARRHSTPYTAIHRLVMAGTGEYFDMFSSNKRSLS